MASSSSSRNYVYVLQSSENDWTNYPLSDWEGRVLYVYYDHTIAGPIQRAQVVLAGMMRAYPGTSLVPSRVHGVQVWTWSPPENSDGKGKGKVKKREFGGMYWLKRCEFRELSEERRRDSGIREDNLEDGHGSDAGEDRGNAEDGDTDESIDEVAQEDGVMDTDDETCEQEASTSTSDPSTDHTHSDIQKSLGTMGRLDSEKHGWTTEENNMAAHA